MWGHHNPEAIGSLQLVPTPYVDHHVTPITGQQKKLNPINLSLTERLLTY